jgi:hypothetical protein
MHFMKQPSHRGVRTTTEIPENLWRAAKIRAINDGTDLRSVIIAALEKHLGITAQVPRGRDRRRKENKETKHAR